MSAFDVPGMAHERVKKLVLESRVAVCNRLGPSARRRFCHFHSSVFLLASPVFFSLISALSQRCEPLAGVAGQGSRRRRRLGDAVDHVPVPEAGRA